MSRLQTYAIKKYYSPCSLYYGFGNQSENSKGKTCQRAEGAASKEEC
jgi:hypothetical protein